MSEIYALTMPKWGLSMEEGTILEWRVAEGDEVTPGLELVDIETTKITNTLEAQNAGTLRRIVAAPGQTLPCGQLIAVITEGNISDDDIATFIETHKQVVSEELGQAQAKPEPVSLDINGHRLRYLELGKGTGVPVVFIHGFGGDLENWMFNQPVLAAARRTIAIDLPGHGGSDKAVGDGTPGFFAAAIIGLLDALTIEKAHVVAHSFGAAVAAALLQSQPNRVASVTAICPMGFGHDINIDYTTGFITARRRSEMAAIVQMLFTNEALVTSEMAEGLLRYKRLDGVGAALQTISASNFEGGSQQLVHPEIWRRLEERLLVIWGQDDKIIPSSHLNAVPDAAQRQLIEGAGHMPHLEKAEKVNELITAFLSGFEQ